MKVFLGCNYIVADPSGHAV